MSNKVEICNKYTLNNPFDNDKDPIHNLLSNYDEIKKIYQNLNNNNDFFKFLYFNKEKVHKILYEEEEIYPINYNDKITFSELFYLSLLILDKENVNYSFSIEYIKSVNNIIKENKEITRLKKILFSKIILILIHNFKGEDEYDENIYGKEIEELVNENMEIIKNNIKAFEDLNLKYNENDIYSKKLDYIYMEIITALIKTNNFHDNCMDIIIEQLELDKIYITDTIFKGLSDLMDINNDYMKEYKINDINDLNDEKKIYFYYILIKFIFKENSLYVYQNDFLRFNIRKIIKLIKNKNTFIELLNNKKEIYEKRKVVLQILPYYNINNYINDINNNTNNNYNNNSNYYNISNSSISKSDINKIYSFSSISKIVENERQSKDGGKEISGIEGNKNNEIEESQDNTTKVEQIFCDKIEYEKAVKILERIIITMQIKAKELNYKEILIGNNFEKLENNLEFRDLLGLKADYDSIADYDDKIQNKGKITKEKYKLVYQNYKRFAIFIENIEEYIKKADIQFNPEITLELERDKKKEKNDIYYIKCISSFKNQINNTTLEYKDENILVNSIKGKSEGFLFLINELINDDYNGAKFIYDENEDNQTNELLNENDDNINDNIKESTN